MHFSNAHLSLVALVASTVHVQAGATVQVTVGENDELLYSPNDITAAVGTAVEFSFFPKNHSVIQSSFADPCHPLAGGFFSSFVPTTASPSGSTFTIIVNDTTPIWIYCGQTAGNHCQSGMVAAINAPATGNDTLAAFSILAKSATASTSPSGGAVGGVLSLATSNSPSSNSSSSNSSSSSSSSSNLSSSAVSSTTSAIVSTSTSASNTSTTTVGSTTNSATASSTSASSSSTAPLTTSTSAASGLVASVFNAGIVIFAILAMV